MTVAASRPSSRIVGAIPSIVFALFALVCAVGLWRVVAILGVHVPLDPNEGWNAYLTRAALAGHLYPGAQAYFVNNYPPLSFYIVGVLAKLVGDGIVAGRIVSLLAFVCVAGGVFQAVRSMNSSVSAALAGALLLAAWLVVGSDYVGMNDPQLLGHALQIAALLFVLKRSPSDITAAVFFALSLFVKHNLVAMPVAAGLWLVMQDRARALRFTGSGVAAVALGLVLFRLLYGSDLWEHLASARTYSFARLTDIVESWLVWGIIPLLIAGGLGALCRHDRYVRLVTLYAAIAVLVGVGFSGGAGVDANVFFDADIALSLCVALAFDRFGARGRQWQALVAALLLLPLASGLYQASVDEDWRNPDYWLHPMVVEAAMAKRNIAFIEERRGRALCQMLSFCYWAGKAAEVDVFNTGQQFATGARRDDALVRAIGLRAFAAMQFDTFEPFALGPRVKKAVLQSYRIDHTDDEDRIFLVPR